MLTLPLVSHVEGAIHDEDPDPVSVPAPVGQLGRAHLAPARRGVGAANTPVRVSCQEKEHFFLSSRTDILLMLEVEGKFSKSDQF